MKIRYQKGQSFCLWHIFGLDWLYRILTIRWQYNKDNKKYPWLIFIWDFGPHNAVWTAANPIVTTIGCYFYHCKYSDSWQGKGRLGVIEYHRFYNKIRSEFSL